MIVNFVLGNATVGIPVIAQVAGFKLSPAGNAGVTVQLVIVPVMAGIMLTEMPTVKVALFVPVEPAVKTKFEGAVSVVVLVVVEDEPVELEELPPSNAMGKSAVRGDCPFLPLQPARLNDRIRLRASKRSEK